MTEPRHAGRYELRGKLAQGGMASVYLGQLEGAYDFARWVAVKRMHFHLTDDRKFVDMFLDEARLLSRLRHPNICSVVDFGEDDGGPFIVMEYLHGESLATVIAAAQSCGRMPAWLAARVIADVARGLHTAHELRDERGRSLNLVHRDVSPQNIMVLYDGVSKIMDFGVAHSAGRRTHTENGEVKGRLRFMSPEQLAGAELDRRTDVWALGVTLYEASVGQKLFAGRSEGEVVMRVIQEEIPPPSTIHRDFPPVLEAVILDALQRDPDARIPSARVLAERLEQFLLHTGKLAGAQQVSDWMNAHLSDRRVEREALLDRGFPGGTDEPLEIAEPTGTLTDIDEQRPREASRRMSRRRTIAVTGSLALVASLGVTAALLNGRAGSRGPAHGLNERPPQTPALANPGPAASDRAERSSSATTTTTVAPDAKLRREREPAARAERSGAPRRRRATPETGTINVLAVPAAEVYLGSRRLGTTPLVEVPLPAGVHRLQLRAISGSATRTVRVVVRPGQQARISVPLR